MWGVFPMFRAFVCAVGLFFIVAPSRAATISVTPLAGSDVSVITVEGDLAVNDYEVFRQKAAAITKAIVAFQSDGGNLLAGLQIGKFIRLKNFATLVPEKSLCASACAIAWLGGTQRYMGATAHIGFHAAYLKNTGQESGAANALVGSYLNQIGLSESAIFYVTQAPPTSMTLLTLADAKRFGIDVSLIDLRETASREPSDPVQPNATVRLRDWSRQFIFALYHQMSASNAAALATLSGIFAETVSYFGTDMPREQVIDREMQFLNRWPVRQYKPKDGQVFVNCEEATLVCSVSGVLQFDARSMERNQRSVGEATFQYRLQFSSINQNTPKVLLENGSVLKRNIQVLVPQVGSVGQR